MNKNRQSNSFHLLKKKILKTPNLLFHFAKHINFTTPALLHQRTIGLIKLQSDTIPIIFQDNLFVNLKTGCRKNIRFISIKWKSKKNRNEKTA